MTDTMRLVTVDDVGRARQVLDLNTFAGTFRVRDSFTLGAPPRRTRTVTGSRRYQGNRQDLAGHDNATVGATFVVRDPLGLADPTRAAAELERILAAAELTSRPDPLYVEWGPDGLARRVYFPVRGPATVQPAVLPRQWAGSRGARLEVTWPTAPLAEGLPLDLREDFRPPPDKTGGIINIARNPSAETNVAYFASQAYAGPAPTAPAQVTDNRPGSAGVKAAESSVTTTSANQGVALGQGNYQDPVHRVNAGDRVYGRIWAKTFASAGSAISLWAVVEFFNSSGVSISSSPLGATISPPTGGQWYEFAGAVTAPANAMYARVLAQVQHGPIATVTLRVDDILVAINPTTDPTGYLDGDSPTGRWEGAAHASRSIELVESKLADYTIDAGYALVRQDAATVSGLTNAVIAGVSTTATGLRFRHTGRGYPFIDGAITAGARMSTAAVSGVTTVRAAKQTGGATGPIILAWFEGGATSTLYLIRQASADVGAGQVTLASIAGPAYVTGGRRLWVRLVVVGRYARAELYLTHPRFASAPDYFTTWQDVGVGFGLEGPGQAVYSFTSDTGGGATDARLTELLEEPHTFAGVRAPDSLLLRGIPGSAPARADLELAGATAAVFGVIGWRARARPHNIAWNGDLGADADGWTNATLAGGLNAGGAVSRQASGGPFNNGPYAQIVASATVATGAAFRVFDEFHRGRTYTVELWAAVASGAWEAIAALDSFTQQAASVAPAGAAWTRYTFTFIPNADRRTLELIFRTTAAAISTINVAALRVYEGLEADAPTTSQQTEGRGAFPPFGPILAESDDVSYRSGFAAAADAASPTGRGLVCTAGAGAVRYLIDPELLPAPLLEAGDVDVEVYAVTTITTPTGGPRLTASLLSEDDTRRVYTREYGAGGRTLVTPTANGTVATRLGTLPLTVDGVLKGRQHLAIDYAPAVVGSLTLRYLFLVPVRRRAGSPTGKYNDAYYPTFARLATGVGKAFASDGVGMRVSAVGRQRDTGLGGEPLELEPGSSELALMALANAIPDQPDGATATGADVTFATVHARITPRYRLMRDA